MCARKWERKTGENSLTRHTNSRQTVCEGVNGFNPGLAAHVECMSKTPG